MLLLYFGLPSAVMFIGEGASAMVGLKSLMSYYNRLNIFKILSSQAPLHCVVFVKIRWNSNFSIILSFLLISVTVASKKRMWPLVHNSTKLSIFKGYQMSSRNEIVILLWYVNIFLVISINKLNASYDVYSPPFLRWGFVSVLHWHCASCALFSGLVKQHILAFWCAGLKEKIAAFMDCNAYSSWYVHPDGVLGKLG